VDGGAVKENSRNGKRVLAGRMAEEYCGESGAAITRRRCRACEREWATGSGWTCFGGSQDKVRQCSPAKGSTGGESDNRWGRWCRLSAEGG